jgi:hypothetical protein
MPCIESSPEVIFTMNRLSVLSLAIALAVMVSICAPSAHASAALRLFDGASCATSDCITISDTGVVTIIGTGSVSGTPGVANGFVSATVSVGTTFTLDVNTGESKPVIPGGGSMDLTTNEVVASGAGTLTIQWSDINFLLSPGDASMTGGGTISNPAVASITYNAYADPAGGTLFGKTVLLGSIFFNTTPFSGTAGGVAVPPAPYELMQELVYTTRGAGHVSGDFSVEVVPEPASIALLGGILLVTVNSIRRRSKRA